METIKGVSIVLGVLGVLFGYVGFIWKQAENYKMLQLKVRELEGRVTAVEKEISNIQEATKDIKEIKKGISELKKSIQVLERYILGVADKDDVITNVTRL